MAKTLSQDLRSRLIQAVNDGMSRRDAAELFSVGVATAIRWVAEWHATGATRAKPKGGDRRSHRVETHGAFILSAVDTRVDISLAELCEMLRRDHGVHFSSSTIWSFHDRHGLTTKKKRTRRGAGTPRYSRAAREMVRGSARPPYLDPKHLVFIDETGLSTKFFRLRGWTKRGQRCRSLLTVIYAYPHQAEFAITRPF